MRPEKITGMLKNGTSKITGFLEAFRDFALRGNMIDMAVGIIIGSSFNEIVSSLVDDIIMPPVGLLMTGKSLAKYAVTIRDAVRNDAGEIVKDPVTINIGAFLKQLLDFIILALVLFMIIQMIHKLREQVKKQEEKQQEKQQESQEKILKDIRDTLQKQQ